MPHHDPVVETFFETYGIGPEVSEKGELEELAVISVALTQEALADLYLPGETATLHERAFITCVVFVVCDFIAQRLRLDGGSHADGTDLAQRALPMCISCYPDPDPEADAKSTFGRAEADSFQLGLLWAQNLEEKNEALYAAAVALGNAAIARFFAPRDPESAVELRKITGEFFRELAAFTE